MITFIFIMAVLVAGGYLYSVYLKTVNTKEGLPPSISKSYYLWKGSKLGGWEFIFTMLFIGICLTAGTGIHSEQVGWDNMNILQQLGYVSIMLGGFLIALVGFFAHFLGRERDPEGTRSEAKVRLALHLAGSYGGIGLPMLFGLWAAFGWYYAGFSLAFIAWVIILKVKKAPDFIFWVETSAIAIGFAGLIVATS